MFVPITPKSIARAGATEAEVIAAAINVAGEGSFVKVIGRF